MTSILLATLPLDDANRTAELGRALGGLLTPGDTVLLSGPLGAGKSHLARAAIQDRMRRAHMIEDVPSPTYTLVQTYELPDADIVHADLYRLSDPDELLELGFPEIFHNAVCLVEWPDRLGTLAPPDALRVELAFDGPGRLATLSSDRPSWRSRLKTLAVPHAHV